MNFLGAALGGDGDPGADRGGLGVVLALAGELDGGFADAFGPA